jgi:hypothetical protein
MLSFFYSITLRVRQKVRNNFVGLLEELKAREKNQRFSDLKQTLFTDSFSSREQIQSSLAIAL